MTDYNFTLKPSKKKGTYKIDWDSEVVLNHVQVVNKQGLFKLSSEDIKIVLGIEEAVVSRLPIEADTFVSAIRVSKENGKVFKCPIVIDDTVGKFCNLVLQLSKVKTSSDFTKIVWDVKEVTKSLFDVQIIEQETSDDEEVPEPTPEEVDSMIKAKEARKDEYRAYLMALIEEVDACSIHTIDAVEEKLVNGMK